MKKVLKPAEPEEVVYYSDFSGKLLDHNMVPVTVKIECGYGSEYDGSSVELHLTDKGLNNLLIYIKDRLNEETKKEFKRQIDSPCQSSNDLYTKDLLKKLI
jgi:purine-nucleoside phosphorylase